MKVKYFISVVTAAAGWITFTAVLGCADYSRGQSAGVPVYVEDSFCYDQILSQAKKLHAAGKLTVPETVLTNQLFERKSCELKLSAPRTEKLAARDLWSAARAAHLQVGWYFHTTDSDKWIITTGGGYALTKDGAVATCFHVMCPPDGLEEGFLFAVNESGQAYPVTEILAGNAEADVCIVRVATDDLKPLALNTNVSPGDRCVCYSDPHGQRGYYSEGIVSRFLAPRLKNGKIMKTATKLDVTTDWAPGSSGAAVLDECGNAIGHVSFITGLYGKTENRRGETDITIHEASSAKDVLALVKPPNKQTSDQQ
jgi:hypothetical protein